MKDEFNELPNSFIEKFGYDLVERFCIMTVDGGVSDSEALMIILKELKNLKEK